MRVVTGTATIEDVDGFVERLAAIGERHGCAVQAFDARYVAGREHLERAVALADRAFERDENVARDRSVEILLYAAGRRQIDRALEMGVDEGVARVVVVIDGDDEDGAAAALDDVIVVEGWEPGAYADPGRIAEFFGITDAERAATDATLAELVCERVALLDVEK